MKRVDAKILVGILDDIAAEAAAAADQFGGVARRPTGSLSLADADAALDAVFGAIGNLRGMMEDARSAETSAAISVFRAWTVFADTLPLVAGAAITLVAITPQVSGAGLRLNVTYQAGGRPGGRMFPIMTEQDVVQAAMTIKAEVLG